MKKAKKNRGFSGCSKFFPKFKSIITHCIIIFCLSPSAFALNPAETAPPFSLVSQSGEIISLSDFQGKVVYLDFWASWCGPCRHTLPWMQKMQAKYKSQGLEILAVNVDANKGDAKKMIDEIKPVFTVAFDPTGNVAEKYELPTMPSSVLIGKSGKILFLHSGFREGDGEELEAQIEKVLKNNR